jgi:hypothetical protein
MTRVSIIPSRSSCVDENRTNGLIFLFRFAICHRATCGQWVQAIGHLMSREGVN